MGSGRTQDAVGCEFSRFQFKLFANNVTKFGAPGNRTPLLIMVSYGIQSINVNKKIK